MQLRKQCRKAPDRLPVSRSDRQLPRTRIASEPALRRSTISRNARNRFRTAEGAGSHAGVRTVVATGRQRRYAALAALRSTLKGRTTLPPPAGPDAQ